MSLEDYQAQFGATVTTLGRWHDIANGRGFAVLETTDQDALVRVLLAWNASIDFELSLVYDDAEAHSFAREKAGT